MSTATYRILTNRGRRVVITSVTGWVLSDITVFRGNNYRDAGTDAISTIASGKALTKVTEAAVVVATTALDVAQTSFTDEVMHIPPRNESSKCTIYTFTVTGGGTFVIPFDEVIAMYTDEP